MERISVADLWASGRGQLTVGDLNNDGWLDQADMVAFLNGVHPTPLAVFESNRDGTWFDVNNWASQALPDNHTNVAVPAGSRATIDHAGAVAGAVTVRPSGTLALVNQGTLLASSLTVMAGGTLQLSDQALLSVNNLTLEAGAIVLWNGGTIQVDGGTYHQADLDLIVGDSVY